MPSTMRIQPLDAAATAAARPAGKSRLKRLFERQFQRISSAEKLTAVAGDGDIEPSTVNLEGMVLSLIEGGSEKPTGRRRCNCFNNFDDSSDDDGDGADAPPPVSAAEILKGLVLCVSQTEKQLLADVSKIAEKCKIAGKKKDEARRIMSESLRSLNYDASICKSWWEKTAAIPAGEFEYIDVKYPGGERVIVEVDFKSEFDIARSTKSYRIVLQSLPVIFVGKADRLGQVVAVIAEAARQSMKKRGLHFPPWRKAEYLKCKWNSPNYYRSEVAGEKGEDGGVTAACQILAMDELSPGRDAKDKITVTVSPWQPPPVKPKAAGARVVPGLATVLNEE